MISLEIRYFNQDCSHVSLSPQRSCLKTRTDKCCPGFFPSRWISTSDFIPSPICIDLNHHLKAMSFKNVQQQKNTPQILSWWWHLQVRFNLRLWNSGGTAPPAYTPHVWQDCPLSGGPGYSGDTAGMMLIWTHLLRRVTHLQIAMERETRASKAELLAWIPVGFFLY